MSTAQEPDRSQHLFIALASLLVGCAFFALWFWLLPGWLNFHVDIASVTPWRWIAAIPSILGFTVALRCIWDFGWTGRGTPAPVAPPQRLVVVGFYRYVRNPMYVGFFTGWAGLWIIFGRITQTAITVTAIAILGVVLFVIFYEEPTLRSKFGSDYEDYCRNVHRWLPRLQPWNNKRSNKGVSSMEETPRRLGRSIWAILAGFLIVIALTLSTDIIMHAIGLFPKIGQPISDSKPLLLATIYRCIYAIIGSYITARLAPYQPMLHALWGGVIGLVLATIGAVATWNRGAAFGPHWYPIALIITALPCAWAGGRLAEKKASQ